MWTWQWAGGQIMEILQCQPKEFDLNVISSGEPLKIFGCKSNGLKTQFTRWWCASKVPWVWFTNHRGKKVLGKSAQSLHF